MAVRERLFAETSGEGIGMSIVLAGSQIGEGVTIVVLSRLPALIRVLRDRYPANRMQGLRKSLGVIDSKESNNAKSDSFCYP